MLCVYTCRPQITLEFSVWGLPTASSSLIIVVHLLVIIAVILLYRTDYLVPRETRETGNSLYKLDIISMELLC